MTIDHVEIQTQIDIVSDIAPKIAKDLERERQALERYEQELRKIGDVPVSRVAELFGYENYRSVYKVRDRLQKKGWFLNGFAFDEVMILSKYKERHGHFRELPHKKDFNQ